MPLLLLHYHEMWLKGRNRSFFLHKFVASIHEQLSGLGRVKVELEDGRVLVRLQSEQALPAAAEKAQRIFGVAYYSVAAEAERDLATVEQTAWEQLAGQSFRTFAVRVRRADKTLPFRSHEAEQRLGRTILDRAAQTGRSISVDLENPDLTCYVEFTSRRALVYTKKLPGPGGMASNTAGKLVCLLSGGYDSAVAAYKMMKRGARLIFVHFHGVAARPGEASEPVAREIVRTLVPYQGSARLYLVPFYELQREVVLGAPEGFRILIYRRLMLRIGAAIAHKHRALGLVVGDSLGQVASQTLQNMAAVGAVARLPLYRPLVGDDKQEIIDVARRIGTYEISSERFTDCCPVFLPRSPRLFATPEELDRAEAGLDIPSMVSRGVASARREVYKFVDGRVIEAQSKEPAHSDAGLLV
ncbi:MAG: tRNA 4-thiouridine(8) synthase ThiI [Acidobacteria bacterium]|nr:tRNA 4-thiouridine(8) synthase ThiI [Acidobacteriota bacterium]